MLGSLFASSLAACFQETSSVVTQELLVELPTSRRSAILERMPCAVAYELLLSLPLLTDALLSMPRLSGEKLLTHIAPSQAQILIQVRQWSSQSLQIAECSIADMLSLGSTTFCSACKGY